jgi:hypothetical protein
MLLFLPPVVQAVIGVIVLVIAVVLHSVILSALGVLGLAVGGYRWTRSRRKAGYRR